VYDGSLEGLFSCIFEAFASHEDPDDIVPESLTSPRFGQTQKNIETDMGHAKRVQAGIRRIGGDLGYRYVRNTALSDEPDKGILILKYLRHGFALERESDCEKCRRKKCPSTQHPELGCPKVKSAMTSDLANDAISPVYKIYRSICNEREKMLQFVRFKKLEGNLWYAKISPKGNLIPLIMDHFSERFNTEPFIIYDEGHHIAGIWDMHDW
ncbi:MAG: DUF4130 domain-containing protein, partial [Eggerthellaceae bacterium]|nr:DUF4130 domain-containing protein [Eggerthellaceae bacterium]